MTDAANLPLAKGVLRTPDARFAQLAEYPFAPHYTVIRDAALGSLRQHYIDEGPRDGQVILLMHGEPTWSYLYRKMIPPLAAAGYRVIAPDLIGFGKSDKPARKSDYTYARMVGWMHGFLEALDLNEITLFCQDWGGLIGLRLVADAPDRFRRVVTSNTALPDGTIDMPQMFARWRRFSRLSPVFPIGKIVSGGSAKGISADAQRAYDAPFPSGRYKAGARQLPSLVPITRDDPGAVANRKAWESLARFDRPFLTLFGDSDPITGGRDAEMQAKIPGTRGQAHRIIPQTGHFCQEDSGEVLAAAVVDFIRVTP
jgi:haloalkane dehalogenase